MLGKIASSVGDILIEGGVKLLGSTVKGTTELGLRKIGEFVKDKTGIDLYSEELIQSGLTPDQIVTLKKLEQEYNTKIMEMEIEFARIAISDAASARHMQEVALQEPNAGWLPKNFSYLLATFWSIFGAIYLMGVCFFEIPPDNQRFVDITLGYVLGSVVSTIIGFYFGNSFKGGSFNNQQANAQNQFNADTIRSSCMTNTSGKK